jgi:hypothetical protein
MEAIVLDDIAVPLDPVEFRKLTHVDLASDSGQPARAMLEATLPAARPKAMYKVCYIDSRFEDGVELEGIRFTSRVLSTNFSEVERVFPYIATCGIELDALGLTGGDPLAEYVLDGLKELCLRAAVEYLRNHLAGEFGLQADKLSTMNPGSGNRDLWPISQQKPLFRLLGDVEASVGVRLTESLLMTPNKTVSGIFFPTEIPFVSCQLCTRADCPRRRAQYSGVAGLAGH